MHNVNQNVSQVETISMEFYWLSFFYLQTQIIVKIIIVITKIYYAKHIYNRVQRERILKIEIEQIPFNPYLILTLNIHTTSTMKPFHLVQNSSHHKPTDQQVFHTAPFLGPQVKGTQGYQQTLQKIRNAQGYHLVTKKKKTNIRSITTAAKHSL